MPGCFFCHVGAPHSRCEDHYTLFHMRGQLSGIELARLRRVPVVTPARLVLEEARIQQAHETQVHYHQESVARASYVTLPVGESLPCLD